MGDLGRNVILLVLFLEVLVKIVVTVSDLFLLIVGLCSYFQMSPLLTFINTSISDSSLLHFLYHLSFSEVLLGSPSLPLWLPTVPRTVITRGFDFGDHLWVSRQARRETKGGHRTPRVSRWKFPCCFDQPFVFGAIHLQCGCESDVSTEWLMLRNVFLMWRGTELLGNLKCFQNGNKVGKIPEQKNTVIYNRGRIKGRKS